MKRLTIFLCLSVAVCIVQCDSNPETVELNLPDGRVRGSFMTTRLDKKIYAFRGLRYAEPPVGELRFKQAVPVSPWTNVFNASEEGPSCPQPHGKNQSEDCLRLNVYTKALPSLGPKIARHPSKPVIVYFHPGIFYYFSGQSLSVGPQFYLDQDIVLVTVNFRLGSLGMISTGDEQAPGNLALKDQVEALRWVKKNIAHFGGDPNSVTISGYSSGSWSVSLHLLSPMSRGLFHRAIAMSGAATYHTPLEHHQMNLAVKQAQILACPTNSSKEIIDCLRTKDAIEMAATLPQFHEWNSEPVRIWSPVVEPEIPGVERFLTDQPSELIKRGEIADVPVIAGICKDEFGAWRTIQAVVAARKGNTSIFDDLNENWDKVAPISFYYERDTPKSKEISAALKKFYFNDKPIGLDNYEAYARLYADAVIIYDVHSFVKLMGQHSKSPVYFYNFVYQGRYSHSVWPDSKQPYGVVHHDDLYYLFHNDYIPYFTTSDPEYEMVKTLTGMWANFAKTGDPIPRSDPKFANVTWTSYKVAENNYLEINNTLAMKTNLYSDRMTEWERLFPIVSPSKE